MNLFRIFNLHPKISRSECEFINNGFARIFFSAHGYDFNGWIMQTSKGKMAWKALKLDEEWPTETNFDLNYDSIIDSIKYGWKQNIKVKKRIAYVEIFKESKYCKFKFDRGNIYDDKNNFVDNYIYNLSKIFPIHIK
jgi:hypothetical protein